MDDTLTWLPPDGDVTGAHVRTLGDMISEAFHAHKKREREARLKEAKEARKKSSTAAESSEWDLDTSVKKQGFLQGKKITSLQIKFLLFSSFGNVVLPHIALPPFLDSLPPSTPSISACVNRDPVRSSSTPSGDVMCGTCIAQTVPKCGKCGKGMTSWVEAAGTKYHKECCDPTSLSVPLTEDGQPMCSGSGKGLMGRCCTMTTLPPLLTDI